MDLLGLPFLLLAGTVALLAGTVVNRVFSSYPTVAELLATPAGPVQPHGSAQDVAGASLAVLAPDWRAQGQRRAAHGQGSPLDVRLSGAASGLTREGLVYLPAAWFQPGRGALPVVELFHGYRGVPDNYRDQLDVGGVLDREIAAGRVPPVVAVVPHTYQGRASECVDAVHGQRNETYLLGTCRPACTAPSTRSAGAAWDCSATPRAASAPWTWACTTPAVSRRPCRSGRVAVGLLHGGHRPARPGPVPRQPDGPAAELAAVVGRPSAPRRAAPAPRGGPGRPGCGRAGPAPGGSCPCGGTAPAAPGRPAACGWTRLRHLGVGPAAALDVLGPYLPRPLVAPLRLPPDPRAAAPRRLVLPVLPPWALHAVPEHPIPRAGPTTPGRAVAGPGPAARR